eukprot:g71720.t1
MQLAAYSELRSETSPRKAMEMVPVPPSPRSPKRKRKEGREIGQLLDMATVRRVPFDSENKGLLCMAVDPRGRYVVLGAKDFSLTVYHLETPHAEPARVLKGHRGEVLCVALDGVGDLLASGSADNDVRVWDVQQHEPLSVLSHHTGKILCVAFDSSRRYVVSGSDDFTIRIWDLEQGKGQPPRVFSAHTNAVTCVAIYTSINLLVSGSADKTVRVWRLDSVEEQLVCLQGHGDSVQGVTLDSLGRYAVSGAADCTVRVWDLQAPTQPPRVTSHSSAVTCIALDSTGRYVASGCSDQTLCGCSDQTLCVLDLQAGAPPRVLKGHSGALLCVAFDTSTCVVSGARDVTVRVWDLEPEERPPYTLDKKDNSFFSMALDPSGRFVAATGPLGRHVLLWDLEAKGRAPREFKAQQKGFSQFTSVAFDPSGKYIVTGSEDKVVQVWDMSSLEKPLHVLKCRDYPTSVAVGVSARYVLTGYEDCALELWDLETKGQPSRVLTAHSDWVTCVALDPCGRFAVSGSKDTTLRLWSLGGEAQDVPARVLEGHTDWVTAVALDALGAQLVSGSQDGTVRVWQLQGKSQACRVLTGHALSVRSVAFAASGRYVVSGGMDGTIRIWDLQGAESKELPWVLTGYAGSINNVAIDASGERVVFSHHLDDQLPAMSTSGDREGLLGASEGSIEVMDVRHWTQDALLPVSWLRYYFQEKQHAQAPDRIRQALLARPYTLTQPAVQDWLRKQLRAPGITALETCQVLLGALAQAGFGISTALLGAAIESKSLAKVEAVAQVALNWAQQRAPDSWACFGKEFIPYLVDYAKLSPDAAATFLRALNAFPASRLDRDYKHTDSVLPESDLLVAGSCDLNPFGLWERLEAGGSSHKLQSATSHKPATQPVFLPAQVERKPDADAVLTETRMIPFQGAAQRFVREDGTSSSLLDELVKLGRAELLDNFTMRAVNKYKWYSSAKAGFIRSMVRYFAVLLLLIAFSSVLSAGGYATHIIKPAPSALDLGALSLCVLVALASFWELWQLSVVRRYRGALGMVDSAQQVLSLVQLAAVGVHLADLERVSAVVLALLVYCKWLGLLSFFRGFRSTGPLIAMIWAIMVDMRFFLLVLSIAIFAVANAFFILLRPECLHSGCADANYANPLTTLLFSFTMLILADFDLSVMSSSSFFPLLALLFVVSMIFITIILLNLLIALMSDSFERIQDRAMMEFELQRGRLVNDHDAFMSKQDYDSQEFFPSYLFVLVPKNSARNSWQGDWTGVLGTLKRMYKEQSQDMQQEAQYVRQELRTLRTIHDEVRALRASKEEQEVANHTLREELRALRSEMKSVLTLLQEKKAPTALSEPAGVK